MAKVKAKKTASKKLVAKTKKPVAKKAAVKKPVGKKIIAKSKSVKKPAPVKVIKAKSATAVAPKPANQRPAGVPEKLRDAALAVLDERQAEDIMTFDLGGRSSFADYLIVASGRSSRQLSAIAHYLTEAFEKLGISRVRVEGLQEANWVLVDGGDVIVHLFLPEVRGFYNLEGIWSKRGA